MTWFISQPISAEDSDTPHPLDLAVSKVESHCPANSRTALRIGELLLPRCSGFVGRSNPLMERLNGCVTLGATLGRADHPLLL